MVPVGRGPAWHAHAEREAEVQGHEGARRRPAPPLRREDLYTCHAHAIHVRDAHAHTCMGGMFEVRLDLRLHERLVALGHLEHVLEVEVLERHLHT